MNSTSTPPLPSADFNPTDHYIQQLGGSSTDFGMDTAVQASAKRQREASEARMLDLAHTYLYDQDDKARQHVDQSPTLNTIRQARGQGQDEFHTMAGDDIAHTIAKGDVYSAFQSLVKVLPEERQRHYQEQLKSCITSSDGRRLLSRTYEEITQNGYTKAVEQQKANQKTYVENRAKLDKGLVEAVSGNTPLSPELLTLASKHSEDPEQLVASVDRSRLAVERLRALTGNQQNGEKSGEIYLRAKELQKEFYDSIHLFGDDNHQWEDFVQRAKAEKTESVSLTRSQVLPVLSALKDKDGNIDERALALFQLSLDQQMHEQRSLDSEFLRNFGNALQQSASNTADAFSGQFMHQSVSAAGAIQPFDSARYAEHKAMREEYYNSDVGRMMGALSQLEGSRLTIDAKADLFSYFLSDLGSDAAGTAPYLITGPVGAVLKGLSFVGDMNKQSLEKSFGDYDPNTGTFTPVTAAGAEGFLDAASNSAQELVSVFAAKRVTMLGKFGRGLLTKAGMKSSTSILPKTAYSTAASALAAYECSSTLKLLGGATAGVGEELFREPLLGTNIEYVASRAFRAFGIDVKAREWDFAERLQQNFDLTSKEGLSQFLTTLCMVSGMRAGYGTLQYKAVGNYAQNYRALRNMGLRPETAKGIVETSSDRERRAQLARAIQQEIIDDPEGHKSRVSDAKQESIAEYEMLLYREHGIMTKALESAGVLEVEPMGDGKRNLVTVQDYETHVQNESTWEEKDGERLQPAGYEMPTKKIEMTDAQVEAFFQQGRSQSAITYARNYRRAAQGLATARAANEKLNYVDVLDVADMRTHEAVAEIVKNNGVVNLSALKAISKAAKSYGELGPQTIPGVSNAVTSHLSDGFRARADMAVRTGELSATEATNAGTNAFRMPKQDSLGDSVIMTNAGHTSSAQLTEDVLESFLEKKLASGTSADKLWSQALQLREEIKQSTGKDIWKGMDKVEGLDKALELKEFYSHLAQADFYQNYENYDLSPEAQAQLKWLDKPMQQAHLLNVLGTAFNAFKKTEQGKAWLAEGNSLADILQAGGHQVATLYEASRLTEADVIAAVEAQTVVESTYGGRSLEQSLKDLENYESEQQQQDEHPLGAPPSTDIPAEESITGEAISLENETEAMSPISQETGEMVIPQGKTLLTEEEGRGKGLINGQFIEEADGSITGTAHVADLDICADVPQYKKKQSAAGRTAADKDGTTHELSGGWNHLASPIHVWRRANGKLEVISGRHRLAHAKKNGIDKLQVRVYEETETQNTEWAKLHDVELNILDNTCNAIDIAFFFRNNPMSEAEAESRGLMPKTLVGEQTAASRIGLTIANKACDDVYTALINGQCTAEEAYTCCNIANIEAGQKLALEQRQQAKKHSWEYITAFVRQAESMSNSSDQLDLFGNDTSWKEEAEKVARYVSRARTQIKDRLNLLRSSQRIEKRQDIAKQLGATIKTPEDASKLIGKLLILDSQYEHLDPTLAISTKAQEWDGTSQIKLDLSAGSSFSIDIEAWKDEKIKELLETEEGRKFKEYVDMSIDVKDLSGIKNLSFRPLSDAEVKDYSNLLGVDLTGATVEFTLSQFTHIKQEHGADTTNEKEQDQRDFTYKDLLLLPYVLKSKEQVVTSGKSKMLISKSLPDGSITSAYLVLKRSKTKKPRLVFKTAWAKVSGLGLSPKVESLIERGGLDSLPDSERIKPFERGVKKIYPENFESSFSLTTFADMAAGEYSRKTDIALSLIRHADAELRRWNRLFAGKTNTQQAAQELGRAQALMSAIYAKLEPKYRPRLRAQIKLIEIFARGIERGRITSLGQMSKEDRAALEQDITAEVEAMELDEQQDLFASFGMEEFKDLAKPLSATRQRAVDKTRRAEAVRKLASQRASHVIGEMLKEARNGLDRQLADQQRARIARLFDHLSPKKLKNGKLGKGKVNATAYRQLAEYAKMLQSTQEEKETRMVELESSINSGKLEPKEQEKAELELKAWSAFGNVESMNYAAVSRALAALQEYAMTERTTWQAKLDAEKESLEFIIQEAVRELGTGDIVTRKDTKEKESLELGKMKDIPQQLMSLAQMFHGMAGTPSLAALAQESLDAISKGHERIARRERKTSDDLAQWMADTLGLDTERKRNDFMVHMKQKINTGLFTAGKLITVTQDIPIETARKWAAMSKEEREAERERIKDEAAKNKRVAKGIIHEGDIPLIKQQLHELDSKQAEAHAQGKKGQYRTTIHTRRQARSEKRVPLIGSRDQLLFTILQSEQQGLDEMLDRQGFTPEVLDQLKTAIGADALAYGYQLRDLIGATGIEKVFEEREGTLFNKVDNYYPARWDMSNSINESLNALDVSFGAQTRYGMLIERTKHDRDVDLQIGASNIFMSAMAQQNNYICMGELTGKWRRLIANKDFAHALQGHLGNTQFKTLKQMINLLDGAGVMEAVTQQGMNDLLSKAQAIHAPSVLAGNLFTLAKQTSAVLHGLAAPNVSGAALAKQLIINRMGGGKLKMHELQNLDCIKARYSDNRLFKDLMSMSTNAKWSRAIAWSRAGMDWIQRVDIYTNSVSMLAVYNITWSQLEKQNEGNPEPMTEEQMHAECERVVRNTLDMGAQPIHRTQKSAFQALGGHNWAVRSMCYMGSETINKVGMYQAIAKREGGGWRSYIKAYKYIVALSSIQQAIMLSLDIMRGNTPDDDDEIPSWLVWNLITGVSGAGLLQGVPVLGEIINSITGGYIKTDSYADMLFGTRKIKGSVKKGYKMATDDKEYTSAEWQDWASIALRNISITGVPFGGVNSTSQAVSTTYSFLQSVNMAANMFRPLLQRASAIEKKAKKSKRPGTMKTLSPRTYQKP